MNVQKFRMGLKWVAFYVLGFAVVLVVGLWTVKTFSEPRHNHIVAD